MIKVTDAWANNKGIRLHYLDGRWEKDNNRSPLVYISGSLAGAESFTREDMEAFAPRRCVSVSLRGRGRSDSPKSGYSFEDHVSDMETIVDSAKLTSFYVLAYSMGVPVALGYVIRHPDRLRGAILLDYPARYPLIPVDWLERAKEYAPANVKAHVIEAIQRESSEVLLWNDLKVLECPVLVIQAGKKGALLTDDMVELYKKHLADCMAVKFDESDHQLWKPDPQKFFRTITAFLDANEAEDR